MEKDSAQQLLENAKQLQQLAVDMMKGVELAEKTMNAMQTQVEPQDRKYFNEALQGVNKLLNEAKNGGDISQITGRLNAMLNTQMEIKKAKNGGQGTK